MIGWVASVAEALYGQAAVEVVHGRVPEDDEQTVTQDDDDE